MSYKAKKCGIRFEPPAIVLVYEKMEGKTRQRIMPIRNFSKFSVLQTEGKNTPTEHNLNFFIATSKRKDGCGCWSGQPMSSI
uniref:Centrosomal protein of 19 kDa n=1 Tax=Pyxicephalus adspersus TaxID=30357 RepID=A0AAV3AUY7_PYXAD|nr:TPA: hypothetical protein GDO54_010197 [Pyxicephalus adspersus]